MASIIAFIISNGKSLNEYLIIFCSFFALGVDLDPFCLFDSAGSFAVCLLLWLLLFFLLPDIGPWCNYRNWNINWKVKISASSKRHGRSTCMKYALVASSSRSQQSLSHKRIAELQSLTIVKNTVVFVWKEEIYPSNSLLRILELILHIFSTFRSLWPFFCEIRCEDLCASILGNRP